MDRRSYCFLRLLSQAYELYYQAANLSLRRYATAWRNRAKTMMWL